MESHGITYEPVQVQWHEKFHEFGKRFQKIQGRRSSEAERKEMKAQAESLMEELKSFQPITEEQSGNLKKRVE